MLFPAFDTVLWYTHAVKGYEPGVSLRAGFLGGGTSHMQVTRPSSMVVIMEYSVIVLVTLSRDAEAVSIVRRSVDLDEKVSSTV